jgi:sugar O-acyltransferase (sialic acid O-acetyltransferase NeuD family)
MQKLAIIGAGDLGQLIAHHAINDGHYELVAFFDDVFPLQHKEFGVPVVGRTNQVFEFYKNNIFDCIMLAIGYKHMDARKKKFEELKGKIPFGRVIHSSSYIDKSVKLGEGVFILPGCTVDKDVVLGDNVLLNTGVVIAHDTTIDSHCFVSPAASIAGKLHIKECCSIGINATIIDNVTIEKNIRIGGGAVVITNLTEPGLYVGVPAKKVK